MHCTRLFSPQRILLGSDYPFPLGEARPGQLICEAKELSEEEKAAMLWDNAIAFLGLEKREAQLRGARQVRGSTRDTEADRADAVEAEQRRRSERAEEAEIERIQQQLEAYHQTTPSPTASAPATPSTSDRL